MSGFLVFLAIVAILGFLFLVLFSAFGDDQLDRMGGSCKAAAMRALNGDDEP